MSITYPTKTETNFPEAVDNLTRMSDLEHSDLTLVDEYYRYYNEGNLTAAYALISENPSLQTKIFNAAKFNKLADGISAVQEYFINELQGYLNEQLTYKEPYSPTAEYIKTNIVDFNGEGFICRADNSLGVSPVNSETTETWALIAKQGIQGVSGIGLSPRGSWLAETQYYANDCVFYNNAIWSVIVDNINSTPSADNPDWLSILSLPFGKGANEVAAGDHAHGNITSEGKVGIVENLAVFTGVDGKLSTKNAFDARAAIGALSVNDLGVSNGVAPLDENGRLKNACIPAFYSYGNQAPNNKMMLWIDITPVTGGLKYFNGNAWVRVPVSFTS